MNSISSALRTGGLAIALLLHTGCHSIRETLRPDAGPSPTDAGGAPLDAGAVDTWSNFAQPFLQTYCVACHDSSPRDFSDIQDVRASAAVARCGVSDVPLEGCGSWPPPRQFPIGDGPRPSDEERERFVRWLDDGAPE